jgi:uncharacterized protein YbjT (DUF2867 family)
MFLVTGARGNVGGALAAQLAAEGRAVRGLVRDPAASLPAGVEPVVGDLGDPDSLGAALDGVTGVFLLAGYPEPEQIFAHPGLERAVLLSSSAVTDATLDEPESTNEVVAYNQRAEWALRSSGLAFTVLRPVGFHSNLLRWRDQVRTGDVVRAPWPDVAIASIDPADIAAVAAHALVHGYQDGRALRLTGPEALTPAQRVAILGEALGRALRYEPQDDATARQELLAAGTPPGYADAFFRFFTHGETDETTLSDTVEQVLGRPPRSLRAWAQANAAALA